MVISRIPSGGGAYGYFLELHNSSLHCFCYMYVLHTMTEIESNFLSCLIQSDRMLKQIEDVQSCLEERTKELEGSACKCRKSYEHKCTL